MKDKNRNLKYGKIVPETQIVFKSSKKGQNKFPIKIMGGLMEEKQVFKKDFNFQTLGIGGLDY